VEAREQFFILLREAVTGGTFIRLTLSKNAGADPALKTIIVRPVELKGTAQFNFVFRYRTRDITKNFPAQDAIKLIEENAGEVFRNIHLQTNAGTVQLLFSRKGKPSFAFKAKQIAGKASGEHDRQKKRMIDPARPFLKELGVTNAAGNVLPAMTRKWKQINAFLEVIERAMKESDRDSNPLLSENSGAQEPARPTLNVADFGAGKGYLTFAVHDYLNSRNIKAHVTGIELHADLVDFCNGAAEKLNLNHIQFRQGDLNSVVPETLNIMIALHACDTATDIAMYTGVRTGAEIILCAPCCHKELRPQIKIPAVLKPVLIHGVHLGQEADMITDSMRALCSQPPVIMYKYSSLFHRNIPVKIKCSWL